MCTLGNLGSPGNFHLGDSGDQDFYLRGLWRSGKLILVDCLCVCGGGGVRNVSPNDSGVSGNSTLGHLGSPGNSPLVDNGGPEILPLSDIVVPENTPPGDLQDPRNSV